jgi:hypothetical protein
MNRSSSHRDSRRRLSGICLSAALGAALLTLLPSVAAAAEERPVRRVLLLADKPGDLFVERIKAEIEGLGLAVVVRAPSGPLEEAARSQHAIAAIRPLPARNGVEVWMADETSGRSLLRQVVVDESPNGPDQNLIALQTVELLRTSLFPKTPEIPPRNPPISPPPPQAETAAATVAGPGMASAPAVTEPVAKMGAQAGVGTLLSLGGPGPELQVWLSLHRFFGRRLGLAADIALPVVRSTLDGPEGKAKIGTAMAGLAFLARLRASPTAWFLNAGLGAAVLRVGVDGEAVPTLRSSATSVLTGAGYARVDGGYAPSDRVRLGLRLLGGASLDRVHLRFAGNDAGSWGRAFAAAAIFAELDW